jgi:hypothetical protein
MNFILQRYSANSESTQGILLEKEPRKFFSHTIEDQPQTIKVKAETRIPAGFYELKIMKADTPLTVKHRAAYNKGEASPWFNYHIEITGIPGFTSVYVHSGINDDHSAGCLLLVDTMHNNQLEVSEQVGNRSMQAVKRFYLKVYPILEAGGKAFIEIRDENKL